MKNLFKKSLIKAITVLKVADKVADRVITLAKQVAVVPNNVLINEDKMRAYAAAKVAEHATELNNVELSFEPVEGMAFNMIAAYLPGTHTITFPAMTEQVMQQAITQGMTWQTYVDCTIAHEMGHVLDSNVVEYVAALQDQPGEFHQRKYMAENMFELELTAEKLGAQFAKDKKAFRTFNVANQAAYVDVIKQIKTSIGAK